MKIAQLQLLFAIALLLQLPVNPLAQAAPVIWDGPTVSFSKAAFADASDPANQDFLTANVSITRDSSSGIYNPTTENFYLSGSPADTEWAFGTTSNLGSLTFDSWVATVAPSPPKIGPPNSVGQDMVLHLITDDIYLDLMFTSWGVGTAEGGAFSYRRSSPSPTMIPEPSGFVMAAVVGLAVFGIHRRRRG
ncbi:MAG: hypothetical protein ACR2NU_12090 [Aeoliella sp.]